MKTLQKILIWSLCLVIVSSLAACGGGAGTTSTSTTPPASSIASAPSAPAGSSSAATPEVTPAKVVMWVGTWWEPEVEHIVSEFAAENEGWSVEIVLQPISGYLDTAIAAVASGAGPDVLDLDTLMLPSAIDSGLITPLDDFMTRYGHTRDMYVEANWDAGVAGGKVYALPNRYAASALVYNKSMFDAAGLDYPVDRMPTDDFRALAKALTKNGQYGFGICGAKTDPATVMSSIVPFLGMTGGAFLTEDMSAPAINTPESVAGITNWVEMYTVDKSVPEGCIDFTVTRDLLPMFHTQSLAMIPLNDNQTAALGREMEAGTIGKFEYGAVKLPGPGRGAGWSFTIPAGKTTNVEAAEYFINYYAKPEVASRNNTVMPASKEAQKLGKWGSPNMAIFYDGMDWLMNCPPHPKWTDMQMIVIEEMQEALTGALTPQEACDNVAKRFLALM